MRFTTLSNYYLTDWRCDIDFCLLACWIAFRYCYSYLTWETGGLELAPTIILVLQAKLLTKCARSFESRNTSIQKECCFIYIFHSTILIFNVATAWKVSKDSVFSGPYFTVFSPSTGKCGTEKTLYLDTFFTKLVSLFQFALIIICDFCAIWYHLYNSKNVKNTHGGVLKAYNFTRSSTSPWMFFTFFKLYKWFQIAQHITFDSSSFWPIDTSFKCSQFSILLSFSLLLWTVFFQLYDDLVFKICCNASVFSLPL